MRVWSKRKARIWIVGPEWLRIRRVGIKGELNPFARMERDRHIEWDFYAPCQGVVVLPSKLRISLYDSPI